MNVTLSAVGVYYCLSTYSIDHYLCAGLGHKDDGELESAATTVGHIAVALLFPDRVLAGLDLQTLAKCAFSGTYYK